MIICYRDTKSTVCVFKVNFQLFSSHLITISAIKDQSIRLCYFTSYKARENVFTTKSGNTNLEHNLLKIKEHWKYVMQVTYNPNLVDLIRRRVASCQGLICGYIYYFFLDIKRTLNSGTCVYTFTCPGFINFRGENTVSRGAPYGCTIFGGLDYTQLSGT